MPSPSLHTDRSRAESFGAEAERYDRARPGYPEALIDDLVAGRPRTVLDVGCGTGLFGRRFAARGCEVLGVEPDPRMAALARGHGLAVDEAAFETWDAAGRTFDLLVSAQAWHWVDPTAGVAKAAEVLAPGGRVGVVWNLGHAPPPVQRRLDAVYAQRAPDLDEHSVLLGDTDDRIAATMRALAGHGSFVDVARATFDHDVDYTTAGWLDLLPTHSNHAALPPDRRAHLLAGVAEVLDAAGGRFRMRYEAVLVSAVWSGAVRAP